MPRKGPVRKSLVARHSYNLRSRANLPQVKHISSNQKTLRLPKKTTKNDGTPDHRRECVICLDKDGKQERILCGHAFHSSCINAWLQKNNSCPVCRRPAKEPGPHEESAQHPRQPPQMSQEQASFSTTPHREQFREQRQWKWHLSNLQNQRERLLKEIALLELHLQGNLFLMQNIQAQAHVQPNFQIFLIERIRGQTQLQQRLTEDLSRLNERKQQFLGELIQLWEGQIQRNLGIQGLPQE